MGYDILFLLQHYILYPNHHPVIPITQERRRLLAEGRVPIEDEDYNQIVNEHTSIYHHSDRRPINANKHYGATASDSSSILPYSMSV